MSEAAVIIVVSIGVLALFIFGLLVHKFMGVTSDAGHTVKSALLVHATATGHFTDELHKAIGYFSPVRDIPCKACGGTGKVEKENELVKAIIETLRSKERKRK